MIPLAFTLLVLVCTIFGTTEPSNHDLKPNKPYVHETHGNSLRLAHLYKDNNDIPHNVKDEIQSNRMRHYNKNAVKKKDKVKALDTNSNIPKYINDKDVNHVDEEERQKSKMPNVYINDKDNNHVDEEQRQTIKMRQFNVNTRSKRELNDDPRCQPFEYNPSKNRLTHPRTIDSGDGNYSSNTTCTTTIESGTGLVIELTFVNFFAIEYHPECANDYLEIRDGKFGYSLPVYKFCGKQFPPTITSTGHYLWLKFKSDEIIEYSGFTIEINFPPRTNIRTVHDSCYKTVSGVLSGIIDPMNSDLQTCRDHHLTGPLDIQWKIETDPGTQIYLNISVFQLVDKNNCTSNQVQVFGAEPNLDHMLKQYCSSVGQSLWTGQKKKVPGPTNVMYIRFYSYYRQSNFTARFTQFRTAESCDKKTEFDCNDATCIDKSLRCDGVGHCRLKTDEDAVECKGEVQSLVGDKDTRNILIVFSLILSGMVFVFLFKCTRKLYLDQKQINEHRAHLCDLKTTTSQPTLGLKSPRESRNRDTPSNHEQSENEMNRHMFQQKSSSLESDFLRVPVEDEWAETEPILEDVRIQYKGGPARDFSRREESLRRKGGKEKGPRAIKDVSVETQGPQEAESQTRDSLFQTEPIVPKPDAAPGWKSGYNSRAVSGVANPGRPQLTIELMPTTAPDNRPQAEGRPLSSESTKSAPDVIQIY